MALNTCPVFACPSVCVCVLTLRLTLAVAQVLDLDALLLLTRRLLHLAGVVVGAAVGGAHWVEADVRTVDVAHTPGRRSR